MHSFQLWRLRCPRNHPHVFLLQTRMSSDFLSLKYATLSALFFFFFFFYGKSCLGKNPVELYEPALHDHYHSLTVFARLAAVVAGFLSEFEKHGGKSNKGFKQVLCAFRVIGSDWVFVFTTKLRILNSRICPIGEAFMNCPTKLTVLLQTLLIDNV